MSSSELMLDVGQANELKLAFRRAGWTNDEIKKLCTGEFLAGVRNVLNGFSQIKPSELIDCDAKPLVPNHGVLRMFVEKHQEGGLFRWDSTMVELFVTKSQRAGWVYSMDALLGELTGKSLLNANVLDYLLAHPSLIPKEWKEDADGYPLCIGFCGTTYRNPYGGLVIRCLFHQDGNWTWDYIAPSEPPNHSGSWNPTAIRTKPAD